MFWKNACLCLYSILLWQMLHVSACFKCKFYVKAKWKTVKTLKAVKLSGTITLIGIVLGGRCPGVICCLSRGSIILGGSCLGSIILEQLS